MARIEWTARKTRSNHTGRWNSLQNLTLVVGPGLVVMLADTEVGSVIAAAQAGAHWGYRLLLWQFALIPVLFMSQELAARLGLATRQGLAELALHRLGRLPAILLLMTLTASCAGALVTELGGITAVAALYGIPAWQSGTVACAGLLTIILTGSYRSVERLAILAGLFEFAFIALAWLARPDGGEIARQLWQCPIGDDSYLYLLAASLGTCVIPWAIFFQQSAGISKGLTRSHLSAARAETLIGAVLCQTITAAVLVAAAAAFKHRAAAAHAFDHVPDIANSFDMAIGSAVGSVVFALGMGGGAMVSSVVITLAAAWAFGEVLGLRHSLSERPTASPWFCVAAATVIIASGLFACSGFNLVSVAIAIGVLNAALLPFVLAILYRLARDELPDGLRLHGAYAVVVAITFAVVAGVGIYASVAGAL